ncbi:hypothetical protein MPLB_1510012 [Mesorhizobium sp. ORS 3324]|nr:hypothetical protein MPLB_1510012 [Mesorhizobium sp. ORS 3324]
MPDDDQAELVVSIGCAVCIFLIGRKPEQQLRCTA